MATRKKAPSPAQPSFDFPSLVITPETAAPTPNPMPVTYFEGSNIVELTPEPVVEERKLRIVPALERGPEEDVVVEPDGDRFAVSLIRHYGGSVATVLYSRRQLEMLLARIPAALEVG